MPMAISATAVRRFIMMDILRRLYFRIRLAESGCANRPDFGGASRLLH
jgi:hypothetical protein